MSSRREETQSTGGKVPGEDTISRDAWPRRVSKAVGGILVTLAFLWLGWLLLHHYGVKVAGFSSLPIPGNTPTASSSTQISPITVAGISLGHPTRSPALTQQQALLIAGQLEPDAATNAKKTSAQYVLLNNARTNTPASHPDLNNVPAWMIVYQQIPLAPVDPAVDSTPFPQTQHDLYVFLDANTGKELLVIWV